MQDKTDTDIPALYRGSVHAKIFHIASYGNQTISSTQPSCLIQISISRRWVCDQQLSDDHQKFMTNIGELVTETISNQPFHRYSWCPPKFKWFTWPNHALFRGGLPSVD